MMNDNEVKVRVKQLDILELIFKLFSVLSDE